MKKVLFTFLILHFTFLISLAQGSKPDLAHLPTTDEVSLSIKGLTLEKKLSQQELIDTKQLDLKGENALKYKLVYYRLKTSYKHTLSDNDEFFNNEITPVMTQFFTDLEKNCKLSFEDVVVQNTETGKQFKIAPLNVVVKTDN